MHRRFRLADTLLPCACCFVLLLLSGCATPETVRGGPGKTGEGPGGVVAQPSSDSLPFRPAVSVPYYPPPSRMDLCGEAVPLDNQEVRERFDREFTLVVYNHAQVYLWLKRMERYFPWIEERLRSYGLPEDLKYVAVVESDLLSGALSPKGAAGPWQFMPATGSAYGLSQSDGLDERYDFERATECAFRFLSDLYKRYRNWTVAIATYNCGDRRIQEQLRTTRDYYTMRLPTETERYIMRILAVKTVLGNPAQYGYNLPAGQGYPPLMVDRVNVNLTCPLPMHAVAEAAGTTIREIKRLNPAFRTEHIPRDAREIKVPEGQGKDLERGLDGVRGRSVGAAGGDAVAAAEDETDETDAPALRGTGATPARKQSTPAAKASRKKASEAKTGGSRSGAAQKKVGQPAKPQDRKARNP